MKKIKILLVTAGILVLILFLSISMYLYLSTPSLPDETADVIESVQTKPLPELVRGQTGFAHSQGLNIWYEKITPDDTLKGTVLLIMGISNDALGCPQSFIQPFLDSGYRVIRYDHRGTGMSDWMQNWDQQTPYSLSDMAADAIAILDETEIQHVHVVGVSMGGMIAQELAINHPDRVASLTSMMSSGFIEDSELPPISSEITWQLIKISLKYGLIGGEENMIKLHIASRIILGGEASYDLNIEEIAQQVLYNTRKRNGYNKDVSQQHQGAVRLSGSRYSSLRNLDIPTLVIHGKADPFIPIAHGKKYASIIPGADTLWIDNMGHDIPEYLADTLATEIVAHFNKK